MLFVTHQQRRNRISRSRHSRLLAAGTVAAVVFAATAATRAEAVPPSILGYATNFDVANGTDKVCEGFEVEIEDVTSSQLTYTWPGNPYGAARTVTDETFPDGKTGIRIRYEALHNGTSWSASTPIGQVNHFGVHINGTAGSQRYSWLCDLGGASAGSTGTLVPYGGTTTGNYFYQPSVPSIVPRVIAAPAGEAIEVEAEPAEAPDPLDPVWPDAVFVVRYEASSPNVVDTDQLLITDPAIQATIANTQISSIAELFQAEPGKSEGIEVEAPDSIDPGDQSSIMIMETYQYTGPVDPIDNEALCNDIVGDIDNCANFIGPMIARQMESAQLANTTPNRPVLTVSTRNGVGTVTSNDVGGMVPGPIDCGATCFTVVDPGTVVALTAVASPGYDFARWSGGCKGTAPTCNVTLGADKLVTAVFAPQPNLKVRIKKDGTVTSNQAGFTCSVGTCTTPFPKGSVVTLTATPAPGSVFVKWTGVCKAAGSNPDCTVTVSSTKSAIATFK